MFILANISMKIELKIFCLTFSNANIQFNKYKLTWRSYTTTKALLIIKQVEIIDKKTFAKAILDKNIKTFVIYVISLNLSLIFIYLAKKA